MAVSHTVVKSRAKVDMAMAQRRLVSIVKCSDGTECPDGNTCCEMTSGKYACCPHAGVSWFDDKILDPMVEWVRYSKKHGLF